VTRALTVQGLRVSKGAKAAIEAAGGQVIGDWDAESTPAEAADDAGAGEAEAPRSEPEAKPEAREESGQE